MAFKSIPPEERFWDKVSIPADVISGCWLWTATRLDSGYGHFHPAFRAHRYSYEWLNGPIPPGLHVLHRCDVRHCVNPAHLFLGTNADNIADKVQKGRAAKGSKNGSAKLTLEQARRVVEARKMGVPLRVLAEEFGVSQAAVSLIANGHNWAAALREEAWQSRPE